MTNSISVDSLVLDRLQLVEILLIRCTGGNLTQYHCVYIENTPFIYHISCSIRKFYPMEYALSIKAQIQSVHTLESSNVILNVVFCILTPDRIR